MDGWSLLYKSVERDLEKKSDLMILFAHWQLLHAGLKCLGIGDDKTLSDSDNESEELPVGWHMNKLTYTLRYKYDRDVFVLIGTVIEDATMVLNLLNGTTLCLSNVEFVLDETVASLTGKLSDVIPDFRNIITRIQSELIDPVFIDLNKISPSAQSSEPIALVNNEWHSLPFLPPTSPAQFMHNDGSFWVMPHQHGSHYLPPQRSPTLQEMSSVPWPFHPPGVCVLNPHVSPVYLPVGNTPPFVPAYHAMPGNRLPAAAAPSLPHVRGHVGNMILVAPASSYVPPDVDEQMQNRLL